MRINQLIRWYYELNKHDNTIHQLKKGIPDWYHIFRTSQIQSHTIWGQQPHSSRQCLTTNFSLNKG